MNLFLKSTHRENSPWPAHDSEVKALFGLPPKGKWPLLGMPPRTIQGITCWVESKPATLYTALWNKPVKSSKHRTFATCPACQKTIPLGRLAQHAKIHKEASA